MHLCITISRLGSGCEAMKSALHACMTSAIGVVRIFCSRVHTRFGSKHFVLRDVARNYSALQSWAICDTFKEQMDKRDGPAHATEGFDSILARDPPMQQRCKTTMALVDPILDVTHEIEGDKPYLSQMLPIIKRFKKHALDWSAENAELTAGLNKKLQEKTVYNIVTERLEFAYHPCMAAAFLLDPVNFEVMDIGGVVSPFALLGATAEELTTYMTDAEIVVKRLGGLKAVAEFEEFKIYIEGALFTMTNAVACLRVSLLCRRRALVAHLRLPRVCGQPHCCRQAACGPDAKA